MDVLAEFFLFYWGSDDEVIVVNHFSFENSVLLKVVKFNDEIGRGLCVSVDSNENPEICVVCEDTIDSEVVWSKRDQIEAIVVLFDGF